eukprot:scaffold394_cov166-Amphora_coffeaeformis.AAC.1
MSWKVGLVHLNSENIQQCREFHGVPPSHSSHHRLPLVDFRVLLVGKFASDRAGCGASFTH